MAATMMALAMIFWAKSSVVATSADNVRPKIGAASYDVMPSAYLWAKGPSENKGTIWRSFG